MEFRVASSTTKLFLVFIDDGTFRPYYEDGKLYCLSGVVDAELNEGV